ncbi:hypothetical protein E4T44_06643 [Aureobasidium sp. EXF-8845]|nr:hypothetical protein E4T44_06643 [Aureobasidium sp. EXF-8845]KAI4846429.1 hypothetical protein E4T45_07254 [Aureobasidium sp. EXF-8846]
MSKEQLAEYAFLKQHSVPKADWSDVAAFREKRSKMEVERLEQQGPPGPGVEEEIKSMKMRDGHQSRIKIHKPTSGGGPLVVLVFGGGFIVGNEEQLTLVSRALAKAFGAIAVTVSYRLAPEHKFPIAAHDVEDSLVWIAERAKDLGADPSTGFPLGGVSAGDPHKGLPPTCIQVAGLDPLRDDGLVYKRVLRNNGIKTKLSVWPGVPHAHFAFFPFLGASKKAMVDIIVGFNWLLGSALSPEQIRGSPNPGLNSGAMGA